MRNRAVVAAIVAVSALFIAELVAVGNFPFDDTYITLRYAQNLALHAHPSFNLDDRVDGYSSPAWMLILAVPLRLGLDGVHAAWLLGKLCGLLGALGAGALALRLGAQRAFALLASIGTATTLGWLAWSAPGMETPFVGLCIVAFLYDRLDERPFDARRAAILIVLALARPECAVLVLAGLARDAAKPTKWVAITVAVLVLLFVAHWAYYGYPLPNTFYAKLAGVHIWERGLKDVGAFLLTNGVGAGVVAAIAIACLSTGTRRWVAVVYVGFVASVVYAYARAGGDYMECHRFYQPLVPTAFAMAAYGLSSLLRGERRWLSIVSVAAAMAWAAVGYRNAAHLWGTTAVLPSVRSYASMWAEAGEALARCYPKTVSMSVRPAGVIPYVTGFRTFDTLGLNTRDIALHADIVRQNDPGHAKEASARQVIAWQPDLIVNHPAFAASDETNAPIPVGLSAYAHAGYVKRCIPSTTRFLCVLARRALSPPTCR